MIYFTIIYTKHVVFSIYCKEFYNLYILYLILLFFFDNKVICFILFNINLTQNRLHNIGEKNNEEN